MNMGMIFENRDLYAYNSTHSVPTPLSSLLLGESVASIRSKIDAGSCCSVQVLDLGLALLGLNIMRGRRSVICNLS